MIHRLEFYSVQLWASSRNACYGLEAKRKSTHVQQKTSLRRSSHGCSNIIDPGVRLQLVTN